MAFLAPVVEKMCFGQLDRNFSVQFYFGVQFYAGEGAARWSRAAFCAPGAVVKTVVKAVVKAAVSGKFMHL